MADTETLLKKINELEHKDKCSLGELEKLTTDVQEGIMQKIYMFKHFDGKKTFRYYSNSRSFCKESGSEITEMTAKAFIKWYLGEFGAEEYLGQLRVLAAGRDTWKSEDPKPTIYDGDGFAGKPINESPSGKKRKPYWLFSGF